jgi:hypothetical protein
MFPRQRSRFLCDPCRINENKRLVLPRTSCPNFYFRARQESILAIVQKLMKINYKLSVNENKMCHTDFPFVSLAGTYRHSFFASAQPERLSLWLRNVYMPPSTEGFRMKLHNIPLIGLGDWGL